jgi:hypothetical protein
MLVDINNSFLVSFFCYWYQHGRHVFVLGFSWELLQTKVLYDKTVLEIPFIIHFSYLKLSGPLSLEVLSGMDFLGKVVKESARKRPIMVISTPEYVPCPMVIGEFHSPPGVSSRMIS